MSGITLKEVDPTTIPAPAAGKDTIFIDSTNDNIPAYKDSAGAVHSLTGRPGSMGPPAMFDTDGDDSNVPIPQYLEEANVAKRNGGNTFSGTQTINDRIAIPFHDNGASGPTPTINWANGNNQILTLSQACTVDFSNPLDGIRVILLIDGAGFTPTWDSDIIWPSGVVPAPSIATKVDLYTFVYSSVYGKYFGAASLDYAA